MSWPIGSRSPNNRRASVLADDGRGRRTGRRQRLRVREGATPDEAHAEDVEVRGAHGVRVNLDEITLASGGILQPHAFDSNRTARGS